MAVDVAKVIAAMKSKIGAPYVWGAEGPNSFDCSGLMVWGWQKVGVQLPRTSQEQARFGRAVDLKDIKPGDLVTSNWGSGPSSHVGMYLGDGKLIHAPRRGRPVTIANLDATYRSKINAVRRVPGASSSGVSDVGLDIPGLGAAEDITGTVLEALTLPFTKMAEGLIGVGRGMVSVGKVAEMLLKLALPSTWVRIVSGVLGTALLFLGVGFLVRETRGA